MKRAGLIVLLVVVVALIAWWTHRAAPPPSAPPHTSRSTQTSRRPAVPRLATADAPAVAFSAPRLDGRVIGSDGHGVAGAVVTITSEPPVLTSTTTTGPDGQFAVATLERRAYDVSALAGDLIAGPISFVAASPHPVLLRLAEGASAIVTVVDASDQQPVAGAKVWADDVAATESDAEGKATLTHVQVGMRTVTVDAPGYAPAWAWLEIGGPAIRARAAIAVRRGVALSGRVIDERRAPVAGARIGVATDWQAHATDVISDARGEFSITALAPGNHQLWVHDGVHAAAEPVRVTIGHAPIRDLEVVLTDGGVISGVVRDDAGRPVPFAEIATGQPVPGETRRVVADGSGAFTMRGVPRSFVALSAERAGARSKRTVADLNRAPHVEVDLVLEVAGSIAGTVIDEHGAPVPGAFVSATPEWAYLPAGFDQPLGSRQAVTDGDGRFTFSGMPEILYRLDAARRPSTPWSDARSPRSAVGNVGDHDVVLELVTAGQLAGRVVTAATGAPPSQATVRIGTKAVPANGDGSFLFQELEPGTYDVDFTDLECAPFVRHSVEIRSGATTDLGTLTAARSRMLTGRVVDATGAPVPGAEIDVGVIRPFVVEDDGQLHGGFHRYSGAVTARDGTFRVTHFTPRPMVAYASHAMYGASAGLDIPGDPSDPETPVDPPPITLVLPGAR